MREWLKWANSQIDSTFRLCMGFSFLCCVAACVVGLLSNPPNYGMVVLINLLAFTFPWSLTFLLRVWLNKVQKRIDELRKP